MKITNNLEYFIQCDYCKHFFDSRQCKFFLLTKKHECLMWCIDCFIDNESLAISKGWSCENYIT